jgi:hypothetical protein
MEIAYGEKKAEQHWKIPTMPAGPWLSCNKGCHGSVMSHGQPKIGHDETVHTTDISKCYKSGFECFDGLIIKT